MRTSAAYRLEVLEQLSSGRRGLAWAKWRLRHGCLWRSIAKHLPALFLVIRIHPRNGPHIFIPLMILPLWILGILAWPIVQLTLKRKGKDPIPGVWQILCLLFRLQFVGRGPVIRVISHQDDNVNIALW